MVPGNGAASAAREPAAWRIFGVPVHIDRSWYLTAFLITWSLATGDFPLRLPGLPLAFYWLWAALAAVLLFACVLLHELGHSLVARAFGIPVHRVTLFVFGGVSHIGREAQKPAVELWVALAGPAVSLALVAIGIQTDRLLPDASATVAFKLLLAYLVRVNAGIILFNLMPGFPLDGGRVLRAFLWMVTGNALGSTKFVSVIGVALGVALIGLGAWLIVAQRVWSSGFWSIFLGAYLKNAAQMTLRQLKRLQGA